MTRLEGEKILNENGFHIGETVLSSNVATQEHTHDFYEIFIIEEGEVNHFINKEQKLMKKGDMYFVRPEDEHCFRKGNCRKAQFVNFAFSEKVFQSVRLMGGQYLDMEGGKGRVEAHVPGRMEIAVLSKLSFLARERSGLFSLSRKGMALSILLDCMIILEGQTEGRASAPEWLDFACREMKKEVNYMEGIQRFVELSGKSQEHLTRSMKKYYDITPTEYLNRIKLEQAAILLETTDDPILDIMFDCGFNNVSYFNRLFKENYGITPGKYRMLNYSVINPV